MLYDTFSFRSGGVSQPNSVFGQNLPQFHVPQRAHKGCDGGVAWNFRPRARVKCRFHCADHHFKNKILTTPYLKRPDNQTLKQLYIIRAVNLNLSEKEPLDNDHLIDSLQNAEIPVYELVDNYYGLLFTAVGNKNQPFNLSKVNFKMNEYDLKDDTEKAIFFFNCMSLCGINIWGFINIAKPMNTKKAYEYIKKFPKFNGRPYYEYQDFYFKDFEMEIVKSNGVESYKSYYLNKYYETLLYHLLCLNVEGASQKEIDDLMLGSILKERSLYPYTTYKETLEGLFKEAKK